MTTDMLSWLRQQIAERKALAESVRIGFGEWRCEHVGFEPGGAPRHALGLGDKVINVGSPEALTVDEARFLEFNDPRQIIADCEADLAILALYQEAANEPVGAYGETDDAAATRLTLEIVIERLASGHRHRPGYLPEWAPERTKPCPS